MSTLLRTSEDYELFLYTITEQFPSVLRSTMTFVRRGAFLARVAGELYFDYEIRLIVRERMVCHRLPIVIDWYGYEIWRSEKKLYSVLIQEIDDLIKEIGLLRATHESE